MNPASSDVTELAPRMGVCRKFTSGLAYGAILTLMAAMMLYLSGGFDLKEGHSVLDQLDIREFGRWITRNLGWSLLPFSFAFAMYLRNLNLLSVLIDTDGSLEQVSQAEHLTEIWISLFFGVGVIWTAIGMRSALLYALGGTGEYGGGDAWIVLQRLIEGGILTALSTTIVGGIGGYLMRISKTLFFGERIKRYYNEIDKRNMTELQSVLFRIEATLRSDQGERLNQEETK